MFTLQWQTRHNGTIGIDGGQVMGTLGDVVNVYYTLRYVYPDISCRLFQWHNSQANEIRPAGAGDDNLAWFKG